MFQITINRPERRNAFRPHTIKELIRAFNDARDDISVGVIILTGKVLYIITHGIFVDPTKLSPIQSNDTYILVCLTHSFSVNTHISDSNMFTHLDLDYYLFFFSLEL